MTAKIINLSRVRKTRARDDKRATADSNAAKHGRSKAEKKLEETRKNNADTRLDQHFLGDNDAD